MIYRGFPLPPPDTIETAEDIQRRLIYYVACLVIDEAAILYGTEKDKAA